LSPIDTWRYIQEGELMRTLFSRVIGVVMLGLTVNCAVAATVSVPKPPATTMPVADDGFLRVDNYGGEENFPPTFCPRGSDGLPNIHRCVAPNGTIFDSGPEVKPVTAQDALDLYYGKGKTVFVGVAPADYKVTVIYWRYAQPAGK
jgi:hypothetical protein